MVSNLRMRRAIPLLVTSSLRAQAQIYLMLIVGCCSRDDFLLIRRVFIIRPYVTHVWQNWRTSEFSLNLILGCCTKSCWRNKILVTMRSRWRQLWRKTCMPCAYISSIISGTCVRNQKCFVQKVQTKMNDTLFLLTTCDFKENWTLLLQHVYVS